MPYPVLPAQHDTKSVLICDSVLAFLGNAGWAPFHEAYIHAMSGAIISSIDSVIQEKYMTQPPAYLIIHGGVYNIKRTSMSGDTVLNTLSKLQTQGGTAIILSHVVVTGFNSEVNRRIAIFNQWIDDVTKMKGWTSLHHEMITPNYLTDGLHLNSKGQKLIFQNLQPFL